jgi:hypothetical protein
MSTENFGKCFATLFLELARNEKKLEVIRQILCELEDFEPYSIFMRLKDENSNLLNGYDISLFLADQFQKTEEELINKTLVYHYDFENDGSLCYAEYEEQ